MMDIRKISEQVKKEIPSFVSEEREFLESYRKTHSKKDLEAFLKEYLENGYEAKIILLGHYLHELLLKHTNNNQ